MAARERARQRCRYGAPGITTGGVAQTIIGIAHEKNADAIVVGKRGAGRVVEALLGSASQKLAALSPLPLTVTP